MSPGDRPSIPLEEEPALFLHAASTGGAVPQRVQPVRSGFGLEEEPALWPSVRGGSAAALPSRAAVHRTTADSAPGARARTLPSTGTGGGSALAGGAVLALAALLRLRARRLAQ